MKKLEKLTLNELENSTQVLLPNEVTSLCGGTGTDYYQMADGVFINYDGYGVYVGNDGQQYVFDGVNVNGCTVCVPDAAYQFNGEINVGSDWGSNFDFNSLKHEYGHYLQQESMGTLDYLNNVAWPSINSVNDPDHSSQSYEEDATQRGDAYMNQYYSAGSY